MFAAVVCPEKTPFVGKISLSHQTVARRVNDLSLNFQHNLKKSLHDCEFFCLCLDESTDVSDTVQLAVFVRGIKTSFILVEELLDL